MASKSNFPCFVGLGASASIFALYAAYKTRRWVQIRRRLLKAVDEKRAARKSNFEAVEFLVKENSAKFDASIVQLEFDILRDRLQNDELTPTEVLLAFQKKALKAQQASNCLVEFLIEAGEWAKNLTQKYHKTGEPKPYLYGIPVSVKETFKVKGHDNTIGLAQWVNRPANEDCWLVSGMKKLGAVPFVLTNVPQTMLSIGSSNPIFGPTLGPFNPDRSPGGSSSGEGALLALGGSPLGLGTDIGGSVRVPASFCGVCSLKPTVDRMSQQGRVGLPLGALAIRSTAGPMAPNVAALIHCCRALWAEGTALDPFMAPVPMNEKILSSNRPLTIGYYYTDHLVDPIPACQRAVAKSCAILQSAGHRLVPFEPHDPPTFMHLYKSLLFFDNGHALKRILNGDILEPNHAHMFAQCPFTSLLQFLGFKATGGFLSKLKSLDHFQKLCTQFLEYQLTFCRKFREAGLDCLVCPVTATVAPEISVPPKLFVWGWNYCALYNLLDYPAGVVPCVLSNEDDEHQLESYPTRGDARARLIKEGGKGALGLPVGIQVVALPYQEEICLRVMSELEQHVKKLELLTRK